MSHYREVIIQTYKNTSGASNKSIRARPIEGQGLNSNINVECSSSMRKNNPIGSLFLLEAKVTDREGTQFLYAHYNTPFRIISEQEANEFIDKK